MTIVATEGAKAEPLSLYKTLCRDLRVSSPLALMTQVLGRTGRMAVFLFRLSSYLRPKGKIGWFFALLLRNISITLTGCEISPHARIGPGFSIAHSCGIVIGNVTAGENLTLFQNVTLGEAGNENSPLDQRKYPVLGNNVMAFAGSFILGGIHIGDNARIGANSVVMADVPANHTAVGSPARLFPNNALPV